MSKSDAPSYIANTGTISLTFEDHGSYGEFLNANRLAGWRAALDFIQPASNTHLVDLGCSKGSWSENWRTLGFERVTGIDVNPDVIEEAEARLGCAIHGGSERLAELDPAPDIVGSNAMIVHVLEEEEEARIFADVHQALRPGGWFVVAVLNAQFYPSPAGLAPHTGPNSCTRELEFHEQLLRQAGFAIKARIGTFIEPRFCEPLRVTIDRDLRNDPRVLAAMSSLAEAMRDAGSIVPFSELLMVCRKD